MPSGKMSSQVYVPTSSCTFVSWPSASVSELNPPSSLMQYSEEASLISASDSVYLTLLPVARLLLRPFAAIAKRWATSMSYRGLFAGGRSPGE